MEEQCEYENEGGLQCLAVQAEKSAFCIDHTVSWIVTFDANIAGGIGPVGIAETLEEFVEYTLDRAMGSWHQGYPGANGAVLFHDPTVHFYGSCPSDDMLSEPDASVTTWGQDWVLQKWAATYHHPNAKEFLNREVK